MTANNKQLDEIAEIFWLRALDMTSPDFADENDYLIAQRNYLKHTKAELDSYIRQQQLSLIERIEKDLKHREWDTSEPYDNPDIAQGYNDAVDEFKESLETVKNEVKHE